MDLMRVIEPLFQLGSVWSLERRFPARVSDRSHLQLSRFTATAAVLALQHNIVATALNVYLTLVMPSTFFSRQDVEQRVPEPSPSRSEGGFVAKLFSCIHPAVASLARSQSTTNSDTREKYQNEVERFFLWGQGVDILEGELDKVLSRSKELRTQVLALLLRLGTAVLQGLSYNKEESLEALERYQTMNSLLEATESMIQDSESDESRRPYTPMGSDVSECGATEILEEISVYIDCLLDLSPSLDNPAFDFHHEGLGSRPKQPDEIFDVSSEEVLIYCRRIRERFESLPKYLVERLAEANSLRAQSLQRLHEVHSEVKKPLPVPNDITEARFSASDHPLTKTSPTVPASSIFSSVMQPPGPKDIHIYDEEASQAAFASLSASASAVTLGRPRVPPIPETLADGWNKLPCSVCFGNVDYIRTRKEWKKHVFDDLKPYVCTSEGCERSSAQFKHSSDWACHMQLHYPSGGPSEGDSADCLFCCGVYQYTGGAFYKHVSAHLREVSLFVLPQPLDEREGIDGDDIDSSESSDIRVAHPVRADGDEGMRVLETKPEKSHPRPWKCPVTNCKYHEYGWPTEKEMDSHYNDKHSANPPMYECLYKPCPYKSKRPSNCNQHMEKQHGWTYARPKTNNVRSNKKPEIGNRISSGSAHPTPSFQNLPTPSASTVWDLSDAEIL